MLSDRNIFCPLGGGEKQRGPMPLGRFLLNDKTIIELDCAKYRDLSLSRRSIICLCLRHRQIIDLLATDKSRNFAQPRPIIV